jgi:hypothetical protein
MAQGINMAHNLLQDAANRQGEFNAKAQRGGPQPNGIQRKGAKAQRRSAAKPQPNQRNHRFHG